MSADVDCGVASAALAAWDPEVDLDEPVAVHVGGCAACRARFDARFPPAVDPAVAVARVEPARRRWTRTAALALAAAAVAAVVTAGGLWSEGPDPGGELLPPECPVELVAVALECPTG